MKPLAFDLRGAKKIAGDKHSSTMELKNGHKLMVMHSALPALQRKQIERLPMATGGEVSDYSSVPMKHTETQTYVTVPKQVQLMATPDELRNHAGAIAKNVNNNVDGNGWNVPSGGDDSNPTRVYPDQTALSESDKSRKADQSAELNSETYYNGGKVKYYADGGQAEADAKLGISKEDQDAINSLPPAPDSQQSFNAAPADITAGANSSIYNPITEAVNAEAPDASSSAPNTTATSANDPYGSQSAIQAQINAVNEQKQGALEQNKVNAQTAYRQADINRQQIEQADKQQKDYQAALQPLLQENQTIAHDVANNHIDPDHYIKSMQDGTKIVKGIGLLLGGLGSGLTGGPNFAFQSLQNNINNDIKAQELNLGAKESLLNNNLRQTGNLAIATNLTALQINSIMSAKLAQNAAYSTNASEKAAALNAKGLFDAKIADLQHQGALQKVLLGGGQGNSPEADFQARMKYLRINGMDKQAAEEEAKHIPGLPGMSSVPVTPANRTQWQNLNNLQKAYNDAQDYLSKVGSAGSGYLRGNPGIAARGKSIQDAMTLEMGKLADLQRFTPEEKNFYVHRVPDLTGTHFTAQDQEKLTQLQKELADKVNTFKSGLGYAPSQAPTQAPKENLDPARAWANDPKNKNDPRLPAVLKKLGGK